MADDEKIEITIRTTTELTIDTSYRRIDDSTFISHASSNLKLPQAHDIHVESVIARLDQYIRSDKSANVIDQHIF